MQKFNLFNYSPKHSIMKKKISIALTAMIAIALFAFAPHGSLQPKPWPVPDAFKNKANPVKSDAASINTGKNLYNQHCKSCHGNKGKGDGPKASQLDTECGDFTKASFQSQTDGAIFYKTSEGRKDMPSYKKKIPEANDIWAVINYLRSLK